MLEEIEIEIEIERGGKCWRLLLSCPVEHRVTSHLIKCSDPVCDTPFLAGFGKKCATDQPIDAKGYAPGACPRLVVKGLNPAAQGGGSLIRPACKCQTCKCPAEQVVPTANDLIGWSVTGLDLDGSGIISPPLAADARPPHPLLRSFLLPLANASAVLLFSHPTASRLIDKFID